MMRKIIVIVTVVANLLLLVATLLWRASPSTPDGACEGTLAFHDMRAGVLYHYEGTVAMHFTPDGTGWLVLSGEVGRGDDTWPVSRQETFAWHSLHDDVYELTIRKVDKLSHDQVPAGLFERFAAGLSAGSKRLINIERTPDGAIVMSNVHAPLLICAE